MRFDLMTGGLPLRRMQQLATDAEAAGFSGLVVTESGRTAYLSCAAAGLATKLDLLTGVAVAFPRSPMVTAEVAWELAELTEGRFRLGLGTQVRAHIERRYGSDFERPGPRLREYVEALRAIFAAFREGTPLAHDGEFWRLSLLPATWSPGAIDAPDPAIDLAAVNPWMLRMAGEVADGVHVHPLNTPTYLRETVLPELAVGAARSGRTVADLEVIVPTFAAPGSTPKEVHGLREMARVQTAFYGSTPNYGFIFEQIGFPGTTERIRERQKAGDIAGMAAVIDDDILEHFCVSGDWATVADQLVERHRGVADRVVSYFAAMAWARDPGALGPWGERAGGPGRLAAACQHLAVARLLPNPAGDLWRRVDKMLADVDDVLPRVDGTLAAVDVTLTSVGTTLSSVDGTLTTVSGTLTTVDGTLRDATDVLMSVRDLLGDLREKLELLDQVPALATQLQDVHRIVTALAADR